jgi:hypothetical protein
MTVEFTGLAEAEARAFASRWLPAWTGNDPERLASYTEDAFYSDPAVPDGIEGRDALSGPALAGWTISASVSRTG